MLPFFAYGFRKHLDHAAKLTGFRFDYGDTVSIKLPVDDTRSLAELMAARGTGRLEAGLARLRDGFVRPFGLKPIGARAMAPFDQTKIGDDHAIFGVDDAHVDFRLVYGLEPHGRQRVLRATSLVRFNHPLGAAYLTAILPGHFLIVRRQLRRIARALPTNSH